MSTTSTTPRPRVKFYRLSDSTSISTPSNNGSQGDRISDDEIPGPELILIGSWRGAMPRHLARYSASYRSLYPNATIIHLSCSLYEILALPASEKRRDLGPVVDVIQAVSEENLNDSFETSGSEEVRRPRILLHIFSSGGSYTASQLARAYREKTKTPIPIDAMVLDSSPVVGSYSNTLVIIKELLSNLPPFLRDFAFLLAQIILLLMWSFRFLGLGGVISRSRKDLNDGQLINKDAPRLYLYSHEDVVALSKDIESHIFDLKRRGGKVQTKLFLGSKHVSHAVTHPEQYWKAISNFWKNLEY